MMNAATLIAFEFPPINMLLRWQDIVPTVNKVVVISILSSLIGICIFLAAARKDPKLAPKGARNLAEIIIDFIEIFLNFSKNNCWGISILFNTLPHKFGSFPDNLPIKKGSFFSVFSNI